VQETLTRLLDHKTLVQAAVEYHKAADQLAQRMAVMAVQESL